MARGKEILSGNIQTTGVMHSCLSIGHFIVIVDTGSSDTITSFSSYSSEKLTEKNLM